MKCLVVRKASIPGFAALLLFGLPASGGIITTKVNPTNGHTYHLLTADTWTASQAEAVALGGNLVTINDAAEDAWVFGSFSKFGGTNRDLWIGLNDGASEGRFVWASGEAVGYTNFGSGQPDDLGHAEDYVHLVSPSFPEPGKWNDFPNDPARAYGRSVYGVVEINTVPEPGSLISAAVGLAVFVARGVWRRRPRAAG